MASKNNNPPIPLNSNQHQNSKAKSHKPSQDQRLVELTKDYKLYRDENKVAYIEIIIYDQGFRETGRNIIRIRSVDFKEYINDLFYRNFFRYPQKNTLESFISHLIFKAKQYGLEIKIFNRLGIDQDENIYVDLANGNNGIVKVSNNGWKVGQYPVLFTRYDHTAPLPEPQEGGNLKDLLQFIPVQNKHEECLLLSWLVASMIPDIDRCFLLLEGLPGSMKSTIANRLKSLIDPMKGDALFLTSKEAEVAQHLGQHCIPYFDNINSISKNISNMFCTCFGESVYSKKALYTDDGSIVFNLTGNMILTSIKLERPRPDFLQRTYKIKTVKKKGFRSTRRLKKQFNQMAPQLFGALLDTLVKVLNIVDQIPEPDKYRTVDFDQYCAAAAEVLGYGQQTFWEARKHTEEIKTRGMVQALPTIQALVEFLETSGGYWRGCMAELLNMLKSFSATPEQLPNSAKSLSLAINKTLTVELNATGVKVTSLYKDHCHLYEILLHDPLNNSQNNNAASPPPPNNSTVDEALEQTIPEQIQDIDGNQMNEVEFSDSNKTQGTEKSAPRDNLDGGQYKFDLDKDNPSVSDEKSGSSVLDQAVSDMYNDTDNSQEVGSDLNPFLSNGETESGE